MPLYKTQLQSCEIYFPNSTNKIVGYEQAPPLPIPIGQKFCCLVKRIFGAWVTWTPEKTQVDYEDGRTIIYWPKPTMEDAILCGPQKGYYRFHKDGSVEHGIAGEYYRWGRTIEVEYDDDGVYETCMLCLNEWNGEDYYEEEEVDDYYDYRDEIGRWYYD